MEASGSPDVLGRSSKSEDQRVKIDEKNDNILFYHMVKMFDIQNIAETMTVTHYRKVLMNFHARFRYQNKYR